jgi:phosphatidate cytidylyltransferase
MLRTRLWMGSVLILLAVAALLIDGRLAPWYPFLLLIVLALGLLACAELLALIGPPRCPSLMLCGAGVIALVSANWLPHLLSGTDSQPWFWIGSAFAGFVLAVFLWEMACFTEPGESVTRMALAVWSVAYLGLLPSFLAQLRWLPAGSLALALVIFVPKIGDSAAYFTGRLLGRHPMAPVLSPKKTWEGAAGHLIGAALGAWAIDQLGPVIPGGVPGALAFGFSLGLAGLLGDLAESLIKRDCQRKDASAIMPGFGGILDVVDSILFAAPVAYWWLS